MTRRLEAQLARASHRADTATRRERTRRLIELGGLVRKAGLDDLAGDDRAALLGGFLTLADLLRAPEGGRTLDGFRHRGRRAFRAQAGPTPQTRS